jgi:predicted RNA-binding Zn-ribbon protein involved in translation (DUF1610 family)
MKLPPRMYLKDRKLGDETFSDFAQGYDQALDDVEQLNATVHYLCPACTQPMTVVRMHKTRGYHQIETRCEPCDTDVTMKVHTE